jgi:integrase
VNPTNALSWSESTETECAKDIWDARYLPGVRYPDHHSNPLLNFTQIPERFRPIVKQFLRFLLSMQSYGTGNHYLLQLRYFLLFFVERYPDAQDFQDLSASDMDAYLGHLKAKSNRFGGLFNQEQVWLAMVALERFLQYLERIESPLAPKQSTTKIIWPEHRSHKDVRRPGGVKYLPETVLQQLDQHLHLLTPTYTPVVTVLRASGWRISDVLNLRHDTCLEQTERGWFLCGDIQKTKVLGHKVPITDDVALLIQTQIALVTKKHSDQDNPKRSLFPAIHARRAGRPLFAGGVSDALDILAQKQQIRGPDGTIFHFRSHAFRHTKAVELINNGMPLMYVQQWMAHLSPEMTLAYAKLLDSTMHNKWEEAMAQEAVRLQVSGQPERVDPEMVATENGLGLAQVRANLGAIRLPNGFCFKHTKFECPAAATPCYRCPMFVTPPAFLSQIEREVRDLQYQVELGQAANHIHRVEANQRKLIKLLPIRDFLQTEATHQPMSKARREYPAQKTAGQAISLEGSTGGQAQ